VRDAEGGRRWGSRGSTAMNSSFLFETLPECTAMISGDGREISSR